jgi:hypothetical protein
MVRHQAISDDLDLLAPAMVCEQIEVEVVMRVRKVDLALADTPLGNVVRNASDNSSGKTGH